MEKAAIPFRVTFFLSTTILLAFFLLVLVSPPPLRAGDGNFVWAKSLGGPSRDFGYDIFVDRSGNVYTTGTFDGTVDFDPGPGTFNLTSVGQYDTFISKLDSNGNFVWAKAIGGTFYESVNDIAVDTSGNVIVTGFFYYTVDFDPGPGTYNLSSEGNSDIFISKLDSSGNFVWAKTMGGALYDVGSGVFVDSSGNIYITGPYYDTVDFDPGPESFNLSSEGNSDIFISKFDSSGNFVWAKAMGGTAYDDGSGITVDTAGNVYTSGYFEGTVDFDPGPASFNQTSTGGGDIYVSKLDSYGNFVWTKTMGGTFDDHVRGIALDTASNVHITGWFEGTADFDSGPGSFYLSSKGSEEIFISKLDSNGNLVWAKAIGGTTYDDGSGITVDTAGNVYTSGYFEGTVDFDPGTGLFNASSKGDGDIFISKLDSDGNFFWVKTMGGTLSDSGKEVSLDSAGNLYITGYFQDKVDFDPGPESFNLTSSGNHDIFIIKLSGPFPWPMFLPAITNTAQQ